jgi:hypothetical protein
VSPGARSRSGWAAAMTRYELHVLDPQTSRAWREPFDDLVEAWERANELPAEVAWAMMGAGPDGPRLMATG